MFILTRPQIPTLDVSHPPASHADRALVRFRAMVQDTSPSPEMYLSKLDGGKPGGWGMEVALTAAQEEQMDYADLRECSVVWAVSIPGESDWVTRDLGGPASEWFLDFYEGAF
jgi:hypothetical protein